MTSLISFAGVARALVGPCELWVDGSFVTEKPDPEDVDLCLVVDGNVFDALGPEAQGKVFSIANGEMIKPDLHVFSIVTRPREHLGHMLSKGEVDYWSQWWSVSRGNWLKGMPVVRLGESDVGLRLLS